MRTRLIHVAHWDIAVPNQPEYDTLIGICNPFTVPQEFKVHFYEKNGVEVPKSPVGRVLQPNESIAFTLIPYNVFQDPPQNFDGDGEIEYLGTSPLELPAVAWRGGNGPGPQNWNYATPSVQIIGGSQRTSGPAQRWVFPYLIPAFMDPVQHAGVHEYRTALRIRNAEAFPVTLSITYRVGLYYDNAGTTLTQPVTIPAGQQFVAQIHELFPQVLTMNQRTDGTYEGSEGWLDISLAGSLIGPSNPVNLFPWLCWGSADFMSQGASQLPWCY